MSKTYNLGKNKNRFSKLYAFWACLEYRDGTVAKIPCKDRIEAREYIACIFDKEKHNKCWTE